MRSEPSPFAPILISNRVQIGGGGRESDPFDCRSPVPVPQCIAGAWRAASRRRALSPLGARGDVRMAAVHGARGALAELAARLLRHGVGCGARAAVLRGVCVRWRKVAASAPPAVVAGPRAVGALVWVIGGVPAAGVAARGRWCGAVLFCGVARDDRECERSAGARRFRHFLRFLCMLGTDGTCFCVSHALRYHPMSLSCVWRAVLENRFCG